MGYKVTKAGATTARFKMLAVGGNNNFVDYETGEIVDVASVIGVAMGDQPFDVVATSKTEEDITPER